MATVKELERAITNLSPENYKKLRDWLDEYESKQWDKQFEDDVTSGKLDTFAKKAIQEYESGNCSEL